MFAGIKKRSVTHCVSIFTWNYGEIFVWKVELWDGTIWK
jgi:hypothetical protein